MLVFKARPCSMSCTLAVSCTKHVSTYFALQQAMRSSNSVVRYVQGTSIHPALLASQSSDDTFHMHITRHASVLSFRQVKYRSQNWPGQSNGSQHRAHGVQQLAVQDHHEANQTHHLSAPLVQVLQRAWPEHVICEPVAAPQADRPHSRAAPRARWPDAQPDRQQPPPEHIRQQLNHRDQGHHAQPGHTRQLYRQLLAQRHARATHPVPLSPAAAPVRAAASSAEGGAQLGIGGVLPARTASTAP